MALAADRTDRGSIETYHRKSISILHSPNPLTPQREAHDSLSDLPIDTQDFTSQPQLPRPVRPTIQFNRITSFQQSYKEQEYSPESLILNQAENDPTLQPRPRSNSHHLSSLKIPSRRWLTIQARFWRAMMSFAVNIIPKLKAPKRVTPAFIKTISVSSRHSKPIELLFYTPPNYREGKRQGRRFPVVIDLHGGGFCLGQATDDRHWARVVMEEVGAVVVSVEYRLAPEHPFPGPVDDCIDALLYLSAHASELALDMSQTILSGFSAGANLAFTAPLRFEFFTKMHDVMLSVPSQASNLSRWPSTKELLNESHLDELRIRSIVAWYPLLDWTSSRDDKRRRSRNPQKTLPKVFTDLFDYSYLPPPDVHGYHCSPYASPALAPDYMLQEGIPNNVQLWLCEYDMLLAEGENFAERLRRLNKNVTETLIPQVPHGFDQSANPMRDQTKIDDLYRKACAGIRDVLRE